MEALWLLITLFVTSALDEVGLVFVSVKFIVELCAIAVADVVVIAPAVEVTVPIKMVSKIVDVDLISIFLSFMLFNYLSLRRKLFLETVQSKNHTKVRNLVINRRLKKSE